MNHEHMLCSFCRRNLKTRGIVEEGVASELLCESCQHNRKAIDYWQGESKWQKEYRQPPQSEPWERVDQKYPSFSKGDSQKILDVVSNTQVNHLTTIDMILEMVSICGELRDSLREPTKPKDTKSSDDPSPSTAENLVNHLTYSCIHTSALDILNKIISLGVSPQNARISLRHGIEAVLKDISKGNENA